MYFAMACLPTLRKRRKVLPIQPMFYIPRVASCSRNGQLALTYQQGLLGMTFVIATSAIVDKTRRDGQVQQNYKIHIASNQFSTKSVHIQRIVLCIHSHPIHTAGLILNHLSHQITSHCKTKVS